MKMRVTVVDDDGRVFEGEAALQPATGRSKTKQAPRGNLQSKRSEAQSIDFGLPERAFMKRHARGMGGAQRFTLLLARMAKGKVGTLIALKDVERLWGRMTDPMGGAFNRGFTTRAKDSGWVDTPKYGYYSLLPGWAAILSE